MDVLEYYQPQLNWTEFKQGPLSDDVWLGFRQLVLLSHSFAHWRRAASERRFQRPPAPYHNESAYMRRKRTNEWQGSIRELENHKMRAAFLAGSKVYDILALAQDRGEAAPDQILSFALFETVPEIVNTMTGHERADFARLAFAEFDATKHVSSDAKTTADLWSNMRSSTQPRSI